MPAFDVPVTHRGFGRTARRDLWWVQPLLTFLPLFAFVVYATWAALQGDHYRYGPICRRSTLRSFSATRSHAWFGGKPAWFPAFFRSLLPCSSSGLQDSSASRATTTAAPTTRHFGPIRPPAPSVSRGRPTAAKDRFLLSCRTFTVTSCTWRFRSGWCSFSTFGRPVVPGLDGRLHFGIGLGTLRTAGERRLPLSVLHGLPLSPSPDRRPRGPVVLLPAAQGSLLPS